MNRIALNVLLTVGVLALSAPVALAVTPGTYTAGDFESNPNHPGSAHLSRGEVECVVNEDQDVDCSAYTLGGVGNTNAFVSLIANYSATIDCTNRGGNLVESHSENFSDDSSATAVSSRNGQLRVPAQHVSAFNAPQICPNPNWTPSIREGTLVLVDFTYTLTFAGFSEPYITIYAEE